MARFSEPFCVLVKIAIIGKISKAIDGPRSGPFKLKKRQKGDNLNYMKLNNQYFILRHGQTIYQKKKRKMTYPWPDNPPVKLTREGKKQIKEVAKKLKNFGIDLIFSSDIFRTRKSAEIVKKELGLKVNFDKRLRDINLGIYHDRLKEEFYRDFPDLGKRFYQRPEKGESWNDVKKRLKNFLKDIEKKYKNKKILIVSHGDPLWLFEGIIKGWSNKGQLDHKDTYIKVGELRK